MIRYKALQILKTFSDKDVREFKLFLLSPFFTTNKSIVGLFKVISKNFHPGYCSIKMTNEYIMKLCKIRKGSTLKNLFADLYPLSEKYLEMKGFRRNSHLRYEALLEELLNPELSNIFLSKYKEINNRLSKSKKFFAKDFYLKYIINDLFISCKDNIGILKNNTSLKDIMKIEYKSSESLFLFSLIDFIKQRISIISHSNTYNLKLDEIPFYNIFIKSFPNDQIKEIIDKFCYRDGFSKEILELYFLNLLFRTTKGEAAIDYFKQYMDLLKKNTLRLSIEERYNFYREFTWLCFFAMEFKQYEDTEFEFYDMYLKNKGFIANGKNYMNLREFKHMLIRGVNTFRYDWTKNYIKKYIKFLPEEYRDTTLRLYNANIFLRKDKIPQKALEELNGIKTLFSYDTKREFHHATIMCYFDLGRYEEVIYKCDSFRHFLINQNIGNTYGDPFKKFLKYIRQITKLKLNNKIPESDIVRKINNDGLVASKLWLIEKIKTFERKTLHLIVKTLLINFI